MRAFRRFWLQYGNETDDFLGLKNEDFSTRKYYNPRAHKNLTRVIQKAF